MSTLICKWPHYLEISSFETSRGMEFLAIARIDVFEGVFHFVCCGGDQTVAALVERGLTIQQVSGEGDDLGHVFL